MDHEIIETCPYDNAHRIFRARMPFHLIKCSKNFPNAKKETCPFDARHVVDEIAFQYHVSRCPAREKVIHYQHHDQPQEEQPKIVPIESFNSAQNSEALGEDWDKEGEVKSYNPLQNIRERAITRQLIGASKSQRKAHRFEERKRFQELENQKERDQKAQQAATNSKNGAAANHTKLKKTTKTVSNDASDQVDQEYKPLRRPRKQPQDVLNASKASMNDSRIIESINNNQEPSLQDTSAPSKQTLTDNSSLIQQNYNDVMEPKIVPFSYAAALVKKSNNNAENSKKECEKENISNNSFFNNSVDSSVIERLSGTLGEMVVGDEKHKKQSEMLDKTINIIKKVNSTKLDSKSTAKSKKLSRCAANFPNLK